MAEVDKVDDVISDVALRRRIEKLITNSKESKWDKFSKHPITMLLLGFLLTWGVGGLLTDHIKKAQLDNEKKLEQIKTKREASMATISKISELMYERYAAASFLASSLKRRAPLEEVKKRKEIYDDAYLRWNTQVQNTQLIIRGLTGDNSYSKVESYIQYGLTPHYNAVDSYLTAGYDSTLSGKKWSFHSSFLRNELKQCLDCCYSISNYLWVRANLYGDEPIMTQQLKSAEDELERGCRRRSNEMVASRNRSPKE